MTDAKTFTFQAETQQLLNILIHSLYTEQEIFLRELVSNASDALNRVQFEQLTNPDMLDADAELRIHIAADEENGTLTIRDTGIGMTEGEMVENLGTIARSGAKAFIQAMQEAKDANAAQDIIGQFGVGFYSVFMVANKVQVISCSWQQDAEGVMWESEGGESYTITTAEKADRGTEIIVHMNEEGKEFLNDFRIREIVRRHSNYVPFPIYVADDEEATNKQTAIWRQSSSDITDEEYTQFYTSMTMDFGAPLHRIHMRADVPMQFYALLFVPSTSEPNMFSLRKEPGLMLYARKVLIQEYAKDLLPEYLQFVQGVVDSEDLPLNVSRETVQVDRIMINLRNTLTNKILNEFKRMIKNDREAYLDLFDEFGAFLKQGVVMEPDQQEKLLELLFFPSTATEHGDMIKLDEYVERMVEGQSDIYYVVADDLGSARHSPHLDAFRQRGIEVLYFAEPVDAMLPLGLSTYRDYTLRSVDEADIDLSEVGEVPEAEAEQEQVEVEDFATIQELVRSILGDRVKDVLESKTLVGSPARLVSDDASNTRYMYRINRALNQEFELPVKTLELNPRHPLIHNLNSLLSTDAESPLIPVVVEQVFENALLQDGIHPDPAAMVDRLTKLMSVATGTSLQDVTFEVAPIAPKEEPTDVEDVVPGDEASEEDTD